MSNEKRKPTWTLCVKEGERWREVGAAWETERGNLFVRFSAAPPIGMPGIMAFPYREQRGPSQYAVRTWRRDASAAAPSVPSKPAQPPPAQPVEDDLPYDENIEPPWL